MDNILIIDDSFTSRLYAKKCICMVLKREDLNIVEAKDGADALDKLESNKIDLIISDVNMPVMTGFTLIRNLKSNPKFSDIPVIFVTSLANDNRMKNLIDLGGFAVIKKPVQPNELGDAVSKLLPQSDNNDDTDNGWG